MTNTLKLLLLSLLLCVCVQAKQQDPLADLKSFAKGALSATAGLCIGNAIGHKIGHPDAATLAGGLLGVLADHYAAGGKRDPHYWWRKFGSATPMMFAAEFIYCESKIQKKREELRAKNDELFADTRLLLKERGSSLDQVINNEILCDSVTRDQIIYFAYRSEHNDYHAWEKSRSAYAKNLLRHVTSISEPQQDGSRIARVGNFSIILRGPGAHNMYNDWTSFNRWKSLQAQKPEGASLSLPANNTSHTPAGLGNWLMVPGVGSHFDRNFKKRVEQMENDFKQKIAKVDEIYADTKRLSEKKRFPANICTEQLTYFVGKANGLEVIKNLSDKYKNSDNSQGGVAQYKLDLLKYVTDISESRLEDGARTARIGDYTLILRGPEAEQIYDLWKSLQAQKPEGASLSLPANNTRYTPAGLMENEFKQKIAKVDEIHADTKRLSEKKRFPDNICVEQLTYDASQEGFTQYKINLLKYVTDISESRLEDGARTARIGDYTFILRGPEAEQIYDLWKSLQAQKPEGVPLSLPANNTRYTPARLDKREGDLPVATYDDLKKAVCAKWIGNNYGPEIIDRFNQEHAQQTEESIKILASNCDKINWNTANPAWAEIKIGSKRFIIQGDLARVVTCWCDRNRDQIIAEITKPNKEQHVIGEQKI